MSKFAGCTDEAPLPAGPYSQSVRIGNLVACAGQAGTRPDGTVTSGVAAQTRQALENIRATLSAAGASEADIAHVRVYLTDLHDFTEMNASYVKFFSEPYPARTTVYVGLPDGLRVEIDALAVIDHPEEWP
jgi:2-iminobutanoate/2-iminopropanoate deaminase